MELLQGEIVNFQELTEDNASSEDRDYVKKIIRITTRQKQKIRVKNFANLAQLCNPNCKTQQYTATLRNLCATCGGPVGSNTALISTNNKEDSTGEDPCPDGRTIRYRGARNTFPIEQPTGDSDEGGGGGDRQRSGRTIRRMLRSLPTNFSIPNFLSINLVSLLFILILGVGAYSLLAPLSFSLSAQDVSPAETNTSPDDIHESKNNEQTYRDPFSSENLESSGAPYLSTKKSDGLDADYPQATADKNKLRDEDSESHPTKYTSNSKSGAEPVLPASNDAETATHKATTDHPPTGTSSQLGTGKVTASGSGENAFGRHARMATDDSRGSEIPGHGADESSQFTSKVTETSGGMHEKSTNCGKCGNPRCSQRRFY